MCCFYMPPVFIYYFYSLLLDVPNIPHSFHNMALVPLWKKNTWMTLLIYINSDNLFSDYKAEPNWKFQLQNNDSPILTNAVVDITVSSPHYMFSI